jgi:uncharacterized protein YlzI (FlbEa/FlbD family)
MFIQLTRTDGVPVWLNASFVVTVEPARSGGSIVVPIGDGLDYEVKESPEAVLALLDDAPPAKVVPVPPPKALAPKPEYELSAAPKEESNPTTEVVPEVVEKKKKRKLKSVAAKENVEPKVETTKAEEPKATKKKRRSTTAKKQPKKPELPADFQKVVEGLKERKCRTVKRLRNAMKSFHGKSDEQEMDRIIEEMMNMGLILVAADGHVKWIEQVM